MAIWYILWPLHIYCGHIVHLFCGHLVHFLPFWYVAPKQIWQPSVHLICFSNFWTHFFNFCFTLSSDKGERCMHVLYVGGVPMWRPSLSDTIFQLRMWQDRFAETYKFLVEFPRPELHEKGSRWLGPICNFFFSFFFVHRLTQAVNPI
jgi:hypothetical protein